MNRNRQYPYVNSHPTERWFKKWSMEKHALVQMHPLSWRTTLHTQQLRLHKLIWNRVSEQYRDQKYIIDHACKIHAYTNFVLLHITVHVRTSSSELLLLFIMHFTSCSKLKQIFTWYFLYGRIYFYLVIFIHYCLCTSNIWLEFMFRLLFLLQKL